MGFLNMVTRRGNLGGCEDHTVTPKIVEESRQGQAPSYGGTALGKKRDSKTWYIISVKEAEKANCLNKLLSMGYDYI